MADWQKNISQTKRKFWTSLKEHQNSDFFSEKQNSALLEHACVTNHEIAYENSKIITTNPRYHQRRCLVACHINSTHTLQTLHWTAMMVYYEKLIWILLIDEVIIGPILTTITPDEDAKLHGVSKRWVMNSNFLTYVQ